MAAADALLYTLRIPRHVVIHNKRAKLEVDSLGSCLCGNHDGSLFAEIIYNGLALVCCSRPCNFVTSGIALFPIIIYFSRLLISIGTIKQYQLTFISFSFQKLIKKFLRASGLG